ncbi:beta-ketoacyl-acyl carrier protein synthase II [Galbibacter marinus]|uniref:Beta-ketoacyl-acyl carrier protein synthase II n=1 Tax=Galbibacter marinus TaxID=555500 RepID=K2PRI7_9FLAO|nr:beta-ketoacyl-[acyl-carrier-protein] synthase family protein [Galbibacter marinus]EKF55175.1 beta-ketoacyl-acyl carrier protein synthase II [Galbibacter marinus]
MDKKRVVITGIGVLSALGTDTQSHTKGIKEGRSGIKPITLFNTEHPIYRNTNACVLDKEVLEKIAKDDKTLQISCGIHSIAEAIQDAKLSDEEISNAALVIGTSIGASHTFSEFFKQYVLNHEIPDDLLELSSNSAQTITGDIADHFGINGPMCTISTACSASTNAVGRGLDMLRSGKATKIIAGGVDIFTELAFTGFNCLQALSTTNCKPFSQNREGLMLGDSSTFFVLEDLESAKKAGKTIYAEVVSYHFFNEGYHPTSLKSDGSSVYQCMKNVLDKADIHADQIDYVNAHGTATKVNDSSELKGIALLAQERNSKEPLYVSSTKSMLGHCLGAAGAVELATTIMGMNQGFIPPNINVERNDFLEYPDTIAIPDQAIERPFEYAISNSFAFGGNMSSILIKNGINI